MPVQHVYTNQVQYVEEGDGNYTTSTMLESAHHILLMLKKNIFFLTLIIHYYGSDTPFYFLSLSFSRSSTFPYTETPLYTQTTAGQYYEGQPTSGTQASTPGTPLTVSVTAGTTGGVSMFVAQPTSAAAATVVSTGGTTNGAVDGAGTNGGVSGSYVIQGGYMLGSSSSSGAAGNSQTYSHNARASPATVSITEGEESSVPSADKKVCRGAKRRNFLLFFFSHSLNPLVAHNDDVIVGFCLVESTIKM